MVKLELSSASKYIRSIRLDRLRVPSFSKYPFNLSSIKDLEELCFHPNVTFIIGENGSGKSTLLEAIAVAYGFNAEGGTKNFNFETRNTHSELNEYIKLVKGIKHPSDGFFLRAESFYNVASNIDDLDEGGISPRVIDSYGGVSLHEQSHGESFFAVLTNRFRGKGIYILDEPEAALSPLRQLSMITKLHELVNKDSQFIIATHSPIIMAYPNADIYKLDNGFRKIAYEETEHFQIMHDFMNNRKKMLNMLME